ncbi:MAG: hypothetical protein HYZ69_04405 [Candidatus Colwellbacteria bacterium]|nr:hypothetical protein [Candidatus Colwellbacteria bacterium]
MDCETLSPNARKIFEKITEYYPNDPWDNMQWSPDGLVCDHGWHDLRRSTDRNELIERYQHTIGCTVVTFAKGAREKDQEITPSVFNWELSKQWIELAVLLLELDFQIETLDLAEDLK